jgi:HAE1 family hydrophobic/amphiphilic exporter-1
LVDFFIRRPVFASVCALLIILAGAVCIPSLPIAQYPTLAPPQVVVTSNYVGANAQVVEAAVTTPLEEAINGVPGMQYIGSTSGSDGTSTITTTFDTGYDLDIAAVDVQNRISSATGQLPTEVNQAGITVTKANSNFVFGAGMFSPDGRYSNLFISNYLDVYVKDRLKRIKGVGDVQIFGERKYAMRIWVDPTKLAARQLTASDVISAIQEQNQEVPAGQLGQPPNDSNQNFEITVNAIGRLTTPKEFDNIVVKDTPNGVVKISDIGYAELGAETYSSDLAYSGIPAVGFGVQQLSNANALEVDREAKAELAELAKSFPPGLKYVVAFDTTTVVGQSIHDVVRTLIEAIVIVIAVIFFFLQDWRAVIIPAVTIPVSLVGTFAFLKIFGFSINTLTLFGIVLATGLVVDDAIVVIENVQRHISEGIADAHEAASIGMREVTGAVIATSLVLISVFIPVSFFPGTTGLLYKQFALTIAFAIAISAFNALTLSPALAALLLRREENKHGILHAIDRGIKAMSSGYARVIHGVVRLRWIMLVLFVVGLAATVVVYKAVPTAFVPDEDQGYLIVQVQAPQGASLSYTRGIEARLAQVIKGEKDIFGTFAITGFSFSGSAPNYGLVFLPLQPITQRLDANDTSAAILTRIRPKLLQIPGALVIPFAPPAISGLGSFGGFQFELQDLGQNTLQDLDRVAHTIVAKGNASGQLVGLFTSFTSNDPELLVSIDRVKAKTLNVPFSQISDSLSLYMGSEYLNNFNFNNRSYRVYAQAEQQYRRTAADIRQFYVRSNSGDMIPLQNFINLEKISAPAVISHYDLFRSAEIDGSAAPGLSSSEGLTDMQGIAKKNMMSGMTYQWTGLALEEIESAGKAAVIFGLGILVVYLTLAALYESFALPFVILLAVPMAVLGALGAQSLRGLPNDVYCQIGLVLLIGLSAKNSILIVEFAEQLRRQGRSIIDAAIEAAELRLRPILMTSFAFILGILPLVFAVGAGANGRHSVGTTIVGGMLVSTILNLFFIPVLYVIIQTLLGAGGRGKSSPPHGDTTPAAASAPEF